MPRFTICSGVVLALVLVIALAACGQDDGGGRRADHDGRLSVVASFYPLAEPRGGSAHVTTAVLDPIEGQ